MQSQRATEKEEIASTEFPEGAKVFQERKPPLQKNIHNARDTASITSCFLIVCKHYLQRPKLLKVGNLLVDADKKRILSLLFSVTCMFLGKKNLCIFLSGLNNILVISTFFFWKTFVSR